MHSWQDRLMEHQAKFIERTLERLAAMEVLIDTAGKRKSDVSCAEQLAHHYHQIAGAAGIYERHDICDLAIEAEKRCLNAMRDGLGAADLEVLGKINASLRKSVTPGQSAGVAQSLKTMESPEVARTGKSQIDVILVDSDQGRMMELSRALQEQGMSVRTCRTESGGREAIHERLPNAMVITIPLADGAGYDLAAELRSKPRGERLPIIIQSRESGFLNKVNAIRCGADAFLDETADIKAVVDKVKELLRRDSPSSFRILSVEDDPDQASAIKDILESVGFNVMSLQDPTKFEDTVVTYNPDLLLLDIMMDNINGLELARYVRQNERFAGLPILFLTTQNALDFHIESALAGGDDHLIKPISPQLLVAAVSGRVGRFRALQKLIGRDGLTQLLSYSAFMDQAAQAALPKSNRFSAAMVMFDVDHLNLVNQRWGFVTGDKIIVELSKVLKRGLRQSEILGRLAGGTFAAIVEDLDAHEMSQVVAQILRDFESIQHAKGKETFSATASAGIAMLEEGNDLATWLSTAQSALAAAKRQGGNRVGNASLQATRS